MIDSEVIRNLYQVRKFKVKKEKLFRLWVSVSLREIGHPPICSLSWDDFQNAALSGQLTCLGKPIEIINDPT